MAKVGKPPVDLTRKLRIFENAIAAGDGVLAALEKAEIAVRTYYDYLNNHPEYSQEIDLLRTQLAELGERAIAKQLAVNPTDESHRKEIVELAKWTIDRRDKIKREILPSNLPALPAPGGPRLTINMGPQMTINTKDLKDDELRRLSEGKTTLEQIIQEREAAGEPIPTRNV